MEVEKYNAGSFKNSNRIKKNEMPLDNDVGYSVEADENLRKVVDLNEHLVINSATTFFMKVMGESMVGAGIGSGDIVIVDQSIPPQNGKIVIAIIDGEMLIRRYHKTMNSLTLIPETTRLSSISITAFNNFKIFGVVTYAIKKL